MDTGKQTDDCFVMRLLSPVGIAIEISQLKYTQGEVTSQSLWSRSDRQFVGITRCRAYCVESNGEDLSCYSNKIESVSLRKCR